MPLKLPRKEKKSYKSEKKESTKKRLSTKTGDAAQRAKQSIQLQNKKRKGDPDLLNSNGKKRKKQDFYEKMRLTAKIDIAPNTDSHRPTIQEIIANWENFVDEIGNRLFDKDKPLKTDDEWGHYSQVTTYIELIKTAHKEKVESDSPIWNHNSNPARAMLHGMKQMSIEMIDILSAINETHSEPDQNLKMLAVYIRKSTLLILYCSHTISNRNILLFRLSTCAK